ncbi:MAG: hypothetical protein RIS29_882 [Bacteroidota bacterium]|jgi:hypothetical protein
MKKSNIILIAFAVFIVGSTLVLYIDGAKHKNDTPNKGFKAITYQPAPHFSVIVTEKDADVHIDFSDTVQIGVEFLGKKKDFSLFRTQGDTLFIKGGLRTFVKCPKLTTLICRHSFWVGVSVYNADTLRVSTAGGQLYFYTADNINEENGVGKIVKPTLILQASNKANVDLYKVLTKLQVHIADSSSVYSRLNIQSVDAQLSKHSVLNLENNAFNLNIQRDSTSTINM